MTKKDLQKELLEKVKPGTKPSHLKRSKSLDDIPPAPPLPPTEIEQLRQENKQLKKEAQLIQAQLKELADLAKNPENPLKRNPPTPLLEDQLKQKQKQIEHLRKQLEETHQELTQKNTELDNSYEARTNSLKDWFKEYSKNKKLDQELEENVEEASNELINQDKKISHLQGQIIKLKQTNQSLQRDLDLATRLAELRRIPLPDDKPNWDYLKLALYSMLATLFTLFLVGGFQNDKK